MSDNNYTTMKSNWSPKKILIMSIISNSIASVIVLFWLLIFIIVAFKSDSFSTQMSLAFLCIILAGVFFWLIEKSFSNKKIYEVIIYDDYVKVNYFTEYLVFDSIQLPKEDIKIHYKLIESRITYNVVLIILKKNKENKLGIISRGINGLGWSMDDVKEIYKTFKEYGYSAKKK